MIGKPRRAIKYEMPFGFKPKAVGRPLTPRKKPAWPEDKLKTCSMCGVVKECRDFHRYQLSKSGYQSRCKICQINSVIESTRANKKRALQYAKDYHQEHRAYRSLVERYAYAKPETHARIRARRKLRRLERRVAAIDG